MIGNILDNTTELCMIKYTFGKIFSSGGATLCENPSDQTVDNVIRGKLLTIFQFKMMGAVECTFFTSDSTYTSIFI